MIWVWLAAGLLVLLAAAYFLLPRPAARRTAPARRPEATTMVLREEQLDLRRRTERLAEVTAHTEVTRLLKTVTVPVTREDLVVEKDGVEAVRIPLREERVDVSTHQVPLNEVSLYKRAWEEKEQVRAVLKKEVARLETTGEATYSEEAGETK